MTLPKTQNDPRKQERGNFLSSTKIMYEKSTTNRAICVRLGRKMIFYVKAFVTHLDYLKIPQVAILGDLHV
jgi:hypothetical protein